MDLIIVESPTKARTLARFLGEGYQIEASMGHVADLPESKLGIDVDHDFAPDYVVPPKKKDRVAELTKAAKKAKAVILATDPDREGEAIAWHLATLLNLKFEIRNLKCQRITFHEITETAIKEALAHPGKINMQLVDAQQARRILDRLVGYKLSPLLWRKVRKGLSAGRVQSVAVRLIVEREREIKAFVPVEYWEITAKLKKGQTFKRSDLFTETEFEAKLVKIGDKAARVGNKDEADRIVIELEKAEYEVSDISKKEVKRYPYPPYTTSTMQQAAANLLGWSARRTMQVAQNLYEQGLITYHRTDSTNLAQEAIKRVRDYIKSQYGSEYLPEAPKLYKTKSKVAQEAHEAIRPTNVNDQSPMTNDQLDRDQKKLYELTWKRFVACQMTEAVYEQTSVEISAKEYLFRAGGNRQVFDGWKALYEKEEIREKKDKAKEDRFGTEGDDMESGSEDEEKSRELPELTVGEILALLGLVPGQHWTLPPPRFTEASLIRALEEFGIGRPSTYAPIISTIMDRQYVEKDERKLVPTVLGFAVNDFLMTNFANILDYGFTAKMEDNLDEVANGEKQWVPVVRDFYGPFAEQLEKVADTAERVKVEVEVSDEVCPNDGAPLVVRIGRFGKFLACSKFPDCKFTKPLMKKLDMKCPKCGEGDVIIRRTRSRKTFYGCSRYPDCDFASWTKPKQS